MGYNRFKDIFLRAVDLIFPLKKIKNYRKESRSWITNGIKISSETKRYLYSKKNRSQLDLIKYKKYVYIYKKVLTQAKKSYLNSRITNSKNPSKTIWDVVKNFTGQESKNNNSVIENLKQGNNKSYEEILNDINKYYIRACPDLQVNQEFALKHVKTSQKTIFLYPTSQNEICSIIQGLKNKKSTGQDEIPVSLIKSVAEEVSGPLSFLVNVCLETGIFPDDLKVAKVKPIYKKGDEREIKNYRPIALLNNFSKIFEKAIYNRLIGFFETENLLSDFQNGFRKEKSTIRAVYQALEKILNSLNKSRETVAMCLDLSKAFDSVDHSLLLEKLARCGIRGVSLRLLTSYLAGRRQYIADDGHESDVEVVRRGVPQGSILGPLLYVIYTNELPGVVSDAVQFADDVNITLSTENEEQMSQSIFGTLSLLENWFASNNLLLNVDKSQLIKFSYKKNAISTTYKSGSREIGTLNCVTFLGIKVDHRLDWARHIDSLAGRIASCCYALRVIATHVGAETSKVAYHAYIHSRLKYGIIFWGDSSEAGRIFVLQKRCIRNMYNLKQIETCRQKFKDSKILTLPSTYILEAVMFVKKNPDLFSELNRGHLHDTRQKYNLKNVKCNFSFIQKNVQFKLTKIFNKIPIEIRTMENKKCKKTLISILLEKCYYSLDEFFEGPTFKLGSE